MWPINALLQQLSLQIGHHFIIAGQDFSISTSCTKIVPKINHYPLPLSSQRNDQGVGKIKALKQN